MTQDMSVKQYLLKITFAENDMKKSPQKHKMTQVQLNDRAIEQMHHNSYTSTFLSFFKQTMKCIHLALNAKDS